MHDFRLRSWSTALVLLAGAAFLMPTGIPREVSAQDHPVMSNVVPDSGTGAVEGKIESIDTHSRQVTILPGSGHPVCRPRYPP
jgi:hypothetical protein